MDLTKSAVRETIRHLKQLMPQAERERQSSVICQRLLAHPRFHSARTILLYYSLPDEPDTHEVVRQWCLEKTVLLPVVLGTHLVLRQVKPDVKMAAGAFHILEPQGRDFEDWANVELAVIPGVAFDGQGRRLGRGGGYYDRLLSAPSMAGVYKIGLCFDFQNHVDFPCEPHDVAVDEVITV